MSTKGLKHFYSTKNLVDSSRRGYFPAKVVFFTETLRELASEKPRILDIACNDGELTKIYSQFGEVIGNDINAEAVTACRKRGLTCLHCDIADMPGRYDGSFDVVLAGDIIEHIFDTDEFLTKVRRLLRPGGRLLLTTPNLASLGRRAMLLFGHNPFVEFSTQLPSPSFNVGHIRYYTARNLQDQLRYHKFKNVRIAGDRINFSDHFFISLQIAKYLPSVSRNLLAYAEK